MGAALFAFSEAIFFELESREDCPFLADSINYSNELIVSGGLESSLSCVGTSTSTAADSGAAAQSKNLDRVQAPSQN
jgi:hypothetical protein